MFVADGGALTMVALDADSMKSLRQWVFVADGGASTVVALDADSMKSLRQLMFVADGDDGCRSNEVTSSKGVRRR